MMSKDELNWKDVRKSLKLTPQEEAEIQIEKELIMAVIDARNKSNLSQRKLSEITGVKQPAIARIESNVLSPRVSTLIRLLYPMGYTLKIVPMKKQK